MNTTTSFASSSRPSAPNVLVVEDDPDLREAVCDTLGLAGFASVSVADGQAALELLKQDVPPKVGLVVSDIHMQPMDGLSLLHALKTSVPNIPVLLMTAFGSIPEAVEAIQFGAVDYLVKPFEAEVLAAKVSQYLHEEEGTALGEFGVVAVDEASIELMSLARRVAESDVSVMVAGESGTGKEVLARFVHAASPRADAPFVALNCAAIPETMLEAILFGYEKGAFTGAQKGSPGKFEQAQGGTLLLDEISEMAIGLQAKLLRVLQEREVERLGATSPIQLDVRVIATTNRDLRAEVERGTFREDLFYRLNVFPLTLAPLRERPNDLVPLAEHLLGRHAAMTGAGADSKTGSGPRLRPDAVAKLARHDWPGNVRELDNVMQRALVFTPDGPLGANDIFLSTTSSPARPAMSRSTQETTVMAEPPPEDASEGAPPLDGSESLGGELRSREFRLIQEAIIACQGSRKLAAERLAVSPRTLRYKLARMREAGYDIR